MSDNLTPDDLPAAWGVPLDEEPPAPEARAPIAEEGTEGEPPFMMGFRDADAPPPEGFVPRLRLGDAA